MVFIKNGMNMWGEPLSIKWYEIQSKPDKEHKVSGKFLLDQRKKIEEQTKKIEELEAKIAEVEDQSCLSAPHQPRQTLLGIYEACHHLQGCLTALPSYAHPEKTQPDK